MPISEKALLEQIKPQLKKIAEDVVDHLYNESLLAVTKFYEDYVPFTYRRTHELYYVPQPIEPYETKKGYCCGIRIIPTMVMHTTHDSSEYVYTGAFELGYHGTSKIAVTSPSPWDRIHTVFRNIGKERK